MSRPNPNKRSGDNSRRSFMYNLVWQSVMCRPGKRLILLVRKNQMLRPTAPTARPRQPLRENASPGII
jgi:hypothetical protein